MSTIRAKEEGLAQLTDVLNTQIVILKHDNLALNLREVSAILNTSKHCAIITEPLGNETKLHNFIALSRNLRALKNLRRQLHTEHKLSRATLIGIYPSLKYPACVYELQTPAERYVTTNVLPYEGSTIKGLIRHIAAKLIGVPPSLGGLGLTLYKD